MTGDSDVDFSEIEERVAERTETVKERLEDIPDSYSMPDPDDMTIHTTKRFELGMVFVDINGFTEYVSRNPYYDTLFMINSFIPEAMEIVRDEGGYFEKNTGDGILAYFGAGDSTDKTATDILRYISTLKYALANYVNPTLEAHDIEPISISTGAAMGETFISRIGIFGLNQRTAISTSANIAAKLEQAADPNEYYIGESIYRNLEWVDADIFDNLGQFEDYYWTESDDYGRAYHHYNISGGWEGTKWENLEPVE